jgi:hypothetical protein
MFVLLVIAAWILVVSIVTSLCAAARAGDRVQRASATDADAGWEDMQPAAWEHAERRREIAARAQPRAAESSVSRMRRDGVAA